jgi:hypothetical protein
VVARPESVADNTGGGSVLCDIARHSVRVEGQTPKSVSSAETKEGKMSKQKFPPDWDEARVKKLLERYEHSSDDLMVAEDEAAHELEGQTLMVMPTELVPAVRELIDRKMNS